MAVRETELDELELEALLYACGDMNADEAQAFEARLALEQPAREALAVAVASLPPLFDNARPCPDYRLRVRESLGGPARWRERRLRGLWAAAGAAAASLAFLTAHASGWLWSEPPAQPLVVIAPVTPAPVVASNDTQQAVHFAELTTVDRLARVHEEASRKRKNDEWRQRHPVPEAVRPMTPMMPPGMSPNSMM